ncbi:MAG: hypothetical protein IPO27_17475 [Bacteroidetes bacterium]|nr:hypothetical protein [Bacteroidota bacterium]
MEQWITNATQIGLAAGTYTVTVFDQSTGCTATCSATVNGITNPTVTCSATDNTSCTIPNGTVSATATGVSFMGTMEIQIQTKAD